MVMYLYFDRQGTLKETIYEPIRQGDGAETIYFHWENAPTPLQSLSAKVRYGDGTYGNFASLTTTPTTKTIPYNQDRDLKYLKYRPMEFFTLQLEDNDKFGLTTLSIIATTISERVVFDLVSFNIEESNALTGGDNIDESQWHALLEILKRNNVAWVEHLPVGQYEMLGYGENTLLFNQEDKKIYQLKYEDNNQRLVAYEWGGLTDLGYEWLDDEGGVQLTIGSVEAYPHTKASYVEYGDTDLETAISGKLDKQTSNTEKVYGVFSGGQELIATDNEPTAYTIAKRDSDGKIAVGDPTDEWDATNKEYVDGVANGKVNVNDIVNDATSTQTNKPLSANVGRLLQEQIDQLSQQARYISGWNCTTGKPVTDPPTLPYAYHSGDYYIINVVGTGTKYKPSGASYTGSASTTTETGTVAVGDIYRYDGTNWNLEINTQRTTNFANIGGQPSDNTALNNALNSKADKDSPVLKGVDIQNSANTSILKVEKSTGALKYKSTAIDTQMQKLAQNGYQNKLTAGNGITINNDTISTQCTIIKEYRWS